MTSVSGIYVILNTRNGKIYIGQAKDFRKRWARHKTDLTHKRHNNQHLQHAWDKYGEKVFRFRVLEYCEIALLSEREQHYLDIYMPKGICYNTSKDAIAPMRGILHTEEAKRKIGDAHRGKTITAEHRRKVGDAHRGKPLNEEHRRKLGESHKGTEGKPMSEETKRKISEAKKGKKLNLTDEQRQQMSEMRKGRIPHNKGIPHSEETKQKIAESVKRTKSRKNVT